MELSDKLIEIAIPALDRIIEEAWKAGYDQAKKDIIEGDIPVWLLKD